ncbi:MAG: aldo/keto reductase family protein [Pirellulales bacterium]
MQYRPVGKSGLKVSAIALGGWLTFGARVDEAISGEIIRAALEQGINFIDLADVYGAGAAEQVVGGLIGELRREDLVLSSKVFWPMSDDPNDRGLGRKHIRQSVERTLRNLRTDYLDLYFCHREDPETPLEETARAMDELVRQGKVLYWGTSVWQPRTLRKAHALAKRALHYAPQVEQPRYNLLDRHIEKRLMPTAARLGMGLVVWSPLAGGILTGKYNDTTPPESRGGQTDWLRGELTDENLRRVRAFCELAREMSVEPAQLALAWILARDEISSVITGATSVDQLRSNLGALDVRLGADVQSRIAELFPA